MNLFAILASESEEYKAMMQRSFGDQAVIATKPEPPFKFDLPELNSRNDRRRDSRQNGKSPFMAKLAEASRTA